MPFIPSDNNDNQALKHWSSHRLQIIGRWQRALLQRLASLLSPHALRDPVMELETQIALNQIVYPEGVCIQRVYPEGVSRGCVSRGCIQRVCVSRGCVCRGGGGEGTCG